MTGQITALRVSQLVRWDKNPRPQAEPEATGELRASIRSKGVTMPLIVRPAAKKGIYEVLGGDTRRSIAHDLIVEGEWPEDATVPTIIREDLVDDDAAALDVAMSNNIHVPVHAMDQFTAFSNLVDLGRSLTEIANAYGISERTVEQRLKYAALDPRTRELVRRDERNLEWASAMTLASVAEQRQILDEIENDPRRHRSAEQVRSRLENELVPVRHALFDVAAVDVNLVRRDLFDPADAAFIPVADFNRLQDEAVADLVKRREGEGWKSVTVSNEREFDRWKYTDGVEDKANAEVIVVRYASGEVVEHAGLQLRVEERINTADSAADEEAGDALFGSSKESIAAAVAKMPLYAEGKATIAYLEKNRALVAQSVLMNDRKLAMATLVASLMADGTPKPLEGRVMTDMVAVDPDNIARVAVERRLDAARQIEKTADIGTTNDFATNVARLRELDDAQLATLLQVEFARRVTASLPRIDSLYGTLVEAADVPLSTLWQPDRAFFETLDKPQLLGLAAEVLPARMQDRLQKQKKSDIAESLFQTFKDAHEGGMRLQHAEREKVTSFAPAMLAGGTIRPEGAASIFGDDAGDEDGEALFGKAA